jgi:GAF domain-containing protein
MNEGVEICQTNSGEYYVRNRTAIDEIVHNVREGHYCTILGPPCCRKSQLLKDVKTQLEATGDELCVLVELEKVDFAVDADFYPGFAAAVGSHLQEQTGIPCPTSPRQVDDERSLQRYLQGCVDARQQDLVLLLDHLERIRLGPLKSLLRVLRAIYTERDRHAAYQLGVVTANSLSTAALALGPVSPFNIARITLIRDLTPAESKKLIDHVMQQKGIAITSPARERCIEATGGDRYLILRLCNHCMALADNKPRKQITKQEVKRAIEWFLGTQAAQYPPLLDTIRAIEATPETLMNVLKILQQERVPRSELALDLAAEIDDLQLTGAVRVQEADQRTFYLMRNEVYRRFLEACFHPDQVARIFSIHGQWYNAIPYLEQLVIERPEHRSSLLGMVVNSIYAARDLSEACAHLGRSLSRAFAIPQARIYLVNAERTSLELVSQAGFEGQQLPKTISLAEQVPEVQAYFGEEYVVAQGGSGEPVLFLPLERREGNQLGSVAIHGFKAKPREEDFSTLLGFLKPVGKAIGAVIERERKLDQLTLLHKTGTQITGSLDLEQVLQTTVESAIQAVPAAQKGSLFLWDAEREKLVIKAQWGFQPGVVEALQLDAGQGYAGWVYKKREPILLSDVHADPRAINPDLADLREEKSSICVPLEAWGRVIGVLCVDNVMDYGVFEENDVGLLSTFGAQAAIAIQNAHLYNELYALGMCINRGDLTDKEIFQQTVRSITRVSDAKGANMLLLRDTDDPYLSVSQKPRLSVSEGLGTDFDEKITPREKGLTFRVLKERKPLAVSQPDKPPGINPLPLERGIQAYLCLPMMFQERITGVLFVHYDKPHAFSENEIEMLSLFANQAALAIENTRQGEELTMTKAVAWMGIVFASLAHRISQKTGAIRNTVWGLRRSLQDRPDVLAQLERIDEYAQTMREIPGRALLPFEDQAVPLDLNDLLRQEIPRWCKPEEEITLDLDGLAAGELCVRADPKWLSVVLETLAANAMRAMRTTPRKKLSVCSQVRGRRVVVEMTDTGQEIPQDVLDHLFKEPIPKDQGVEGSGVGLLIARTIMRRYGGELELLRTGPEGTTFIFWLPLEAPPGR